MILSVFCLARRIVRRHYTRPCWSQNRIAVTEFRRAIESAVGFRSGQTGQTVNLLAMPSKVRILIPPPTFKSPVNIEFAGLFLLITNDLCKLVVALSLFYPEIVSELGSR